MDLHEQLKPIAAEAARTGVPCLPEWLEYVDVWGLEASISDDAARMIAEAGMWRFLSERGVAVFRHAGMWCSIDTEAGQPEPSIYPPAKDGFTALRMNALRVYATLPDAPATAAREEGER